MKRKSHTLASAVWIAALILPMQLLPELRGQEKSGSPKWEFKTVTFSNDENEGTGKLNALADEGWQYVGPLGNGLVAFRRQSTLRTQIILEVVNKPATVAPGKKTTITVIVRDGDGKLLPGANVRIGAGGGKFLPAADTPFDPKDRLHGPYSATGTTDQTGQFTTWWVVNPAAGAYRLDFEASKEGYTGGKTTHLIEIK